MTKEKMVECRLKVRDERERVFAVGRRHLCHSEIVAKVCKRSRRRSCKWHSGSRYHGAINGKGDSDFRQTIGKKNKKWPQTRNNFYVNECFFLPHSHPPRRRPTISVCLGRPSSRSPCITFLVSLPLQRVHCHFNLLLLLPSVVYNIPSPPPPLSIYLQDRIIFHQYISLSSQDLTTLPHTNNLGSI